MTADPLPEKLISIEEYYRLEALSEFKHDYVDGRMIRVHRGDPDDPTDPLNMAGGSPEHSLITANVVGEARNKLKGSPCRVYTSDLKVNSGRHRKTHYPDAMIVCGPLVVDPRDKTGHTATNPTVIVEILSPSTAAYDLDEKFGHYRRIESFAEYVLVRQDAAEVTTYQRRDDGTWTFRVFTGVDATVPLQSVGVTLAMAELYAGVTLPEPPVVPD